MKERIFFPTKHPNAEKCVYCWRWKKSTGLMVETVDLFKYKSAWTLPELLKNIKAGLAYELIGKKPNE